MYNGYPGPGNQSSYRRSGPPQQQVFVDTGSYSNEVDPGMNGDGWQGSSGRASGGSHHMNGGGGGRRGGSGMHNARMPPSQHHGGMNRGMMPPGFRHQQSQYMNPYPMNAMPPNDLMDISLRMGDISLASTPTIGCYGQDLPPPQGSWNQPAPFGAPQDEMFDNGGGVGFNGGVGNPPHHVPFGQRGGGNQFGGGRMPPSRQGGGGGGGYPPRNHQNGGYMPPMMVPPMPGNPQYYGGGGNSQPSFPGSPFSIPGGGSASSMGHHAEQMPGGGGGGPQNGGGGASFQINSSSMDDYSMWTDENDEDAKRKKILRDKGLLIWGDAEVCNNKPIRRWLVPEGQEEDFESAMARCPSHLKKKTLNEEALRRRLGSDNPQVVAHAQQQAEEEASATLKIGKRPIIPCGWGDLPHDMSGEKSDYDQGSSKSGWEDDGRIGLHHHPAAPNHLHHQHNDELVGMSWNLPGVGGNGPSAAVQPNEARNPFFAHHMQQQAQQQHHHVWPSVMEGVVMAPSPSSSATGMSSQMGMLSMSGVGGPTSTSSIAASATAISDDADGSQKKLAENLKLAVEKGHLDISLLSLPHIPSNVLDLLTEILTVIPRLDGFEDELKKLEDCRPSHCEEGSDPETWMNKDQKNEHDKAVIGVVTSKIEVTQLSKKISEALVEAGLIPPTSQSSLGGPHSTTLHHHQGPPSGSEGGGAGPSSSRDTTFNSSGQGGPPDHYYDYSFLG